MDGQSDGNRFMDSLLFRSVEGQTTPDEEELVNVWRRASLDNEAAWQRLARLLALTSAQYLPPDAGQPPDGAALIRRTEARPRSAPVAGGPLDHGGHRLWRWTAGAAVAAVFLFLSVYRLTQPPASVLAFGADEFATGLTDIVTVRLRDGSVVRLAPRSKLRLIGSGTERAVALEGRGYFAVARQPDKPFTVRTRSGDAVVLGTRFEINASDQDLRLVVEEGRVALAVGGRQVDVQAGQMSSVVEGAISTVVDLSDVKSQLGWMGNFLVFQATPLDRVAAEIERHYSVEVTLSGTVALQQEVTATFSDKTLDEVVRIVCKVVGAQCVVRGNTVRIQL